MSGSPPHRHRQPIVIADLKMQLASHEQSQRIRAALRAVEESIEAHRQAGEELEPRPVRTRRPRPQS